MARPPDNLTDRPDHDPPGGDAADLLSMILSRMRLAGEQVTTKQVEAGEDPALAANLASLLIVREGSLGGAAERSLPMIATGDLLLLPHGAEAAPRLVAATKSQLLICRFRFEPDQLPGMVSALPALIHIGTAEAGAWLEGISHFLGIETIDPQPGASLMLARLIDLLVIRTLRTWVHRGGAAGWLGGLADARIARSLKAIHREPFRNWSLAELSNLAGMSRSSYCARFQDLIGESPSRYRNRLRLAEARVLLQSGRGRVGEVALGVGYESEASFSRAYKSQFGISPINDLPR
jgi:AraC-like DNA-binding protein